MSGESVCGVEAFDRGDCRLCNDEYLERARPNDGAPRFGRQVVKIGPGKPVLKLLSRGAQISGAPRVPPPAKSYKTIPH